MTDKDKRMQKFMESAGFKHGIPLMGKEYIIYKILRDIFEESEANASKVVESLQDKPNHKGDSMSLTREELIEKISVLNEAKKEILKERNEDLYGVFYAYKQAGTNQKIMIPDYIMKASVDDTVRRIDKEIEGLYNELRIILGCGESD